MAKKSRGPRKASAQKPRRRTGRSGASPQEPDQWGLGTARPARVALDPAVAVVRSRTAAFRDWLAARRASPEPLDVVDDLERFLALAGPAAGVTDPTRLDGGVIAAMVALLPEMGVPHDVGLDLVASLSLWLDFLDEVGLWRGTPADLEDCQLLLDTPVLDERLVGALQDAEHDPAALAAAVSALPLLGHVRELLEWIRPGRGHDAPEVDAEEADDREADDPVTSALAALRDGGSALAQDPAARAWKACIVAGALAVEDERLVITETGALLLDGEPDVRAEEERALVIGYLAERLTASAEDGSASEPLLLEAVAIALREGSAPVDDDMSDQVGALAEDGLVVLEQEGRRIRVPGPIALVVLAALMMSDQELTRGTIAP